MVKKFEANPDSFDKAQSKCSSHLKEIEKNIHAYSFTVDHIHSTVGVANIFTKTSFYESSAVVCMFARKQPSNNMARQTSSVELSEKKPEPLAEQAMQIPAKVANDGWYNMFKKAMPVFVLGAAVATAVYAAKIKK